MSCNGKIRADRYSRFNTSINRQAGTAVHQAHQATGRTIRCGDGNSSTHRQTTHRQGTSSAHGIAKQSGILRRHGCSIIIGYRSQRKRRFFSHCANQCRRQIISSRTAIGNAFFAHFHCKGFPVLPGAARYIRSQHCGGGISFLFHFQSRKVRKRYFRNIYISEKRNIQDHAIRTVLTFKSSGKWIGFRTQSLKRIIFRCSRFLTIPIHTLFFDGNRLCKICVATAERTKIDRVFRKIHIRIRKKNQSTDIYRNLLRALV